jgi:hypothetical protein
MTYLCLDYHLYVRTIHKYDILMIMVIAILVIVEMVFDANIMTSAYTITTNMS